MQDSSSGHSLLPGGSPEGGVQVDVEHVTGREPDKKSHTPEYLSNTRQTLIACQIFCRLLLSAPPPLPVKLMVESQWGSCGGRKGPELLGAGRGEPGRLREHVPGVPHGERNDEVRQGLPLPGLPPEEAARDPVPHEALQCVEPRARVLPGRHRGAREV